MSINMYNQMHQHSKRFLEDALGQTNGLPCIVITHHLPSFHLVSPKYKDDLFSQCFASNLDDIVERHSNKIRLWCYGHTHEASDVVLHGVRLVCNPIGYDGENSSPYFNKTILL